MAIFIICFPPKKLTPRPVRTGGEDTVPHIPNRNMSDYSHRKIGYKNLKVKKILFS